MRRVYPLRSPGKSACHASVIMLAYKCHACPCAWARELYVRVAFIPRSGPLLWVGRVYSPVRAARNGLRRVFALRFYFLCTASVLKKLRTQTRLSLRDYPLQVVEMCVAWGINARTASLPRGRLHARTTSLLRRDSNRRLPDPAPSVTGFGCWTSPLLWRKRITDLTRRSRGPTVIRALALQDYS